MNILRISVYTVPNTFLATSKLPERFTKHSLNKQTLFWNTQVCFRESFNYTLWFWLTQKVRATLVQLKCMPLFKLQVHRPTASQTRTKRVSSTWATQGQVEVFLCFVLWLSVLLCRQSCFSSLYTWFPSPRSLLNANSQNVHKMLDFASMLVKCTLKCATTVLVR